MQILIGIRYLPILLLMLPLELALPAQRAARDGPAARFEDVGAGPRLSAVLRRIAAGNLADLIGDARWAELFRNHRLAVEGASSHVEFAERLNDLLSATGQSHLRYFTDQEWDYWLLCSSLDRQRPTPAVEHVGIYPRRIDGRWYVRGILEGSPADGSLLRVGDELVMADREPFSPIESFRGTSGRVVRVKALRLPSQPIVVELTPVREPLAQAVRRAMQLSIRVESYDGRRFVYAHVWTLLGAGSLFAELATRSADADGVILDFRDGVGGTTGAALWYLLGRGSAPRGATENPPMDKPVVILISEGTRSAKEIVVDTARNMGRVLLVGEPTSGAVTTVDLAHSGPVGEDAYLLLPGQRLSLEGRPTLPDFAMSRSVPFSDGKDPQLELGREVLAAWLATADRRKSPTGAPPPSAAGARSD